MGKKRAESLASVESDKSDLWFDTLGDSPMASLLRLYSQVKLSQFLTNDFVILIFFFFFLKTFAGLSALSGANFAQSVLGQDSDRDSDAEAQFAHSPSDSKSDASSFHGQPSTVNVELSQQRLRENVR